MSRGHGRNRHRRGGASKKSFPQFEGRVQMTREGFIFVMIDQEGQEDVFVKASKTRNALNGDRVIVAVTNDGKSGRRREGEVVQIVERSRKPFVGYLHLVGAQAWALMQSKVMPYDIALNIDDVLEMDAKTGMKVAVVVDRWERHDPNPVGHITDVLGMPGENDTEMHAILAEFGLPYRFEKEVEDAADSISDKITKEDLRGRKDFRDVFTLTIDPADAKDFDDALSFRRLPGGNVEVGVHIADVSWYVKPDTAVDKEARERGTSVYLVDRTVPMLPEKLCNKLCSLRPDEDKLTFSAVFEMTPEAKVVKYWLGRTVIRSDKRLDYEEAQDIIMSEFPEKPTALQDALHSLYALSDKLRQARFKSGAINFDRPEMKVEVDAEGRPVRVYEKISKEANWLIEEFMLLANRTVAEFVAKKDRTFVYRVHGDPDPVKIGRLTLFAKGFGYKVKDSKSVSGFISTLLSKAKGKPEYSAFEDVALRAMAKATYSTDNIGHYGLAFKYYTHFTSPIRRYPDTMVHRLLAMYLDGAKSQSLEYYENECKHASARELVAADAERTSVKYKLVEFMLDKVGNVYDGHISGITEWGMYVAIEPTKIEGMVPLREIRSDFFDYDEERIRLVGRRTHKVYRYGDAVRIRVKSANLEQRLLDYELVEE